MSKPTKPQVDPERPPLDGQINLRLPSHEISMFKMVAAKKRKSVSKMLRDMVAEAYKKVVG